MNNTGDTPTHQLQQIETTASIERVLRESKKNGYCPTVFRITPEATEVIQFIGIGRVLTKVYANKNALGESLER